MSPISNEKGTLHLAVAGNGNPYDYLTPERLEFMHALFGGMPEAELAATTGLTTEQLDAELQILEAGSLVTGPLGQRKPAFFLAVADELPRLNAFAQELAGELAHYLGARWADLERQYDGLSVAGDAVFSKRAFFLVGDLILDVGLLDALAATTDLMLPAPPRPSPEAPDARFYVWLVEGDRGLLGKYGQRVTALPWPSHELRTFGDYWLGEDPNIGRNQLEALVRERAGHVSSPAALGQELDIPYYPAEDAAVWWSLAQSEARVLAERLARREAELHDLYDSLRAAERKLTTFGEFFCWYDHVIYAYAIDHLAEAGLLVIPDERFTADVWPVNNASAF